MLNIIINDLRPCKIKSRIKIMESRSNAQKQWKTVPKVGCTCQFGRRSVHQCKWCTDRRNGLFPPRRAQDRRPKGQGHVFACGRRSFGRTVDRRCKAIRTGQILRKVGFQLKAQPDRRLGLFGRIKPNSVRIGANYFLSSRQKPRRQTDGSTDDPDVSD